MGEVRRCDGRGEEVGCEVGNKVATPEALRFWSPFSSTPGPQVQGTAPADISSRTPSCSTHSSGNCEHTSAWCYEESERVMGVAGRGMVGMAWREMVGVVSVQQKKASKHFSTKKYTWGWGNGCALHLLLPTTNHTLSPQSKNVSVLNVISS